MSSAALTQAQRYRALNASLKRLRREAFARIQKAFQESGIEFSVRDRGVGIPAEARVLLFLGRLHPMKRVSALIDAFGRTRARGCEEGLKLVIIGDEISKLPALRRAVHSHKLHKHVRFLGYLEDDTLAILYRLASVFVFPSLYEGFGLPPLEAMASGTPVVTSNVSSLPEVAGDAAVLVDPYDVDAIADGMRRVIADPALAADLRRRGLARAREFSWARSVERTLEVYRSVCASR